MQRMRCLAAALLAVLLLCGSFWTSACGFSCGLQQAKQLCAPSSTDHVAMAMNCEHCRGTKGATATPACGTMDSSPALFLRDNAREDAQLLLAGQYRLVAAQTVPVLPDVVSTDAWNRALSGKVAAFSPPLVSLRL